MICNESELPQNEQTNNHIHLCMWSGCPAVDSTYYVATNAINLCRLISKFKTKRNEIGENTLKINKKPKQ